jgi:uncharacterized membrane protein (DUF441 family)
MSINLADIVKDLVTWASAAKVAIGVVAGWLAKKWAVAKAEAKKLEADVKAEAEKLEADAKTELKKL